MKLVPVAYLASYLLSLLGNSIAGIALPLIVLQVTGSTLGAGAVVAATAFPAVLAALVMGVVLDRINRHTTGPESGRCTGHTTVGRSPNLRNSPRYQDQEARLPTKIE